MDISNKLPDDVDAAGLVPNFKILTCGYIPSLDSYHLTPRLFESLILKMHVDGK